MAYTEFIRSHDQFVRDLRESAEARRRRIQREALEVEAAALAASEEYAASREALLAAQATDAASKAAADAAWDAWRANPTPALWQAWREAAAPAVRLLHAEEAHRHLRWRLCTPVRERMRVELEALEAEVAKGMEVEAAALAAACSGAM